jgi:hypothetical protein
LFFNFLSNCPELELDESSEEQLEDVSLNGYLTFGTLISNFFIAVLNAVSHQLSFHWNEFLYLTPKPKLSYRFLI